MNKKNAHPFLNLITSFLLISLFLSSCAPSFSETPVESNSIEIDQSIQQLQYTEIEILLEIPNSTDYEIIFELIDDITGIELNPTRYVMTKLDEKQYQLILPIKVPSQMKYRFYKNTGLPVYETDADNEIIEYRMAYVSNETVIHNVITNWQDEQYDHKFGRITGQVINSESNSPIPNALIVIGGNHSYTNSLGNFRIVNIPPGKHNLVISSTDGEYQTFQQEAIIGEGLTTQAKIGMKSADFVNVSFIVKPPDNTPVDAQLRILGNTYQLGNVFGNIYNGTSIAPARAPKLSLLPDGNYAITLSLPVGFDLRYKYSLGDGFWNAELNNDGNFVVRQFVVPEQDFIVNDVVTNWSITNEQNVEFLVNIPENTPGTDKISIQFNSFGWSPPIQMWKINDFQWKYQLFGPLHLVGKIDYKFCRNDACDTAFDTSAPVNGYSFDTSSIPPQLEIEISSWSEWGLENDEPSLDVPDITSRGSEFITGFAISDDYNVYTPIHIETAYQNMGEVNANTVILPVKWTLSNLNPLVLEPITGINPLWKDLVLMIQKAQKNNLKVWLAPQIELSSIAITQYGQDGFSDSWETQFSNDYKEFLIYTVDLANYMSIEGVIFPSDVIHSSSTPQRENLSQLMNEILLENYSDIQSRFSNKLFLSIVDPHNSNNDLLSQVDGYFITPTIDLVNSESVGENYDTTIMNYLENEIYANYSQFDKEIIIGINYPSINGAEKGCIESEDQCLDFEVVNNLDFQTAQSAFELNLNTQIELIHAMFSAINQLEWVDGIISLEYNPQVAIMDHTSSVRGKPSVGVFWYWYPRLLGIATD
jgi:hypothetical protein